MKFVGNGTKHDVRHGWHGVLCQKARNCAVPGTARWHTKKGNYVSRKESGSIPLQRRLAGGFVLIPATGRAG